jgi:glycosyltransferase involved in cell wall biosynthesis
MDRANHALAAYLLKSGVRVELVSHRVDPVLAGDPGCRFHRVPRPRGWHTAGEPLLDLAGRMTARRLRRDGGVTVVNGGNCLATAANWVHYVHAEYPVSLDPSVRGLKRWALSLRSARRERSALSSAPVVITNSNATRRAVVEHLEVPESRVHTVYYGIDAAAFGPVSPEERARARQALGLRGGPAIAFVGALGDRRKGLDTLFEAMELLASDPRWDAELVVVGTGSELESWRERVQVARLEGRVHLLGFRRDVPFVLSACDLLVAPTRYEAFGLGVAEALARGLPAIVSARAGVAELYPRDLSELLLTDVESPEALAGRLRWWRFDAPNLGERMTPLVERVRRRSWDDMAAEIAALLGSVALCNGAR